MSRSFRPYYVDSRISFVVEDAAAATGELPSEFVEYALLMRVIETCNAQEIEGISYDKLEDLYGEIHQRWEDWYRDATALIHSA